MEKKDLDNTSYSLYTLIGNRGIPDKLKNVYYFIDNRGEIPVKEFINGLSVSERTKVFAYLKELKNKGSDLHRPLADYLGHGIYELRPKANRIFYFFFLRDSAILVHAIRKKTDRIPLRDLEACIKRKYIAEEYTAIEKIDL